MVQETFVFHQQVELLSGELFTFAFGGHESHWSHLQKIGLQELPTERSPQGVEDDAGGLALCDGLMELKDVGIGI